MFRSRFLWRLYAGFALLILVASGILGGLIGGWLEKDFLAEIDGSLQAQALLLRELATPALKGEGDEYLQERLQRLDAETNTRLTVLRADGEVLADSRENPAQMDNHAGRPEVAQARSQGLGRSTRFSATLATRMTYLAVPVFTDERLASFVRASLNFSSVQARRRQLRSAVAMGASLSALAALVLAYLLARSLARPLEGMTSIAESMASGDYSRRLPADRQDEVGVLAEMLNRMAKSCSEREQMMASERNKLNTILEGMMEGVVAVDRAQTVVHMNERAGRILSVIPRESLDPSTKP